MGPLLEEGFPVHGSVIRAALGHRKNRNEKSLSALLTALERELQASVTDSDILVTTQDTQLQRKKTLPLIFLLDNIRSAFNIGSCFRLANALNVQEVILCGYTAGPDHPAVKKSSMGSEGNLVINEISSLEEGLKKVKDQGYQIVALETAEPSTSLFHWKAKKGPTAIWIGNERFGIDAQKLELADAIVSIPMFGSKNSLNVAVALSVVSYEWLRQYQS